MGDHAAARARRQPALLRHRTAHRARWRVCRRGDGVRPGRCAGRHLERCWRSEPNSTVGLIRDDGWMVSRYPVPPKAINLSGGPLFDMLRKAPEGVLHLAGLAGRQGARRVAYVTLPDLGLDRHGEHVAHVDDGGVLVARSVDRAGGRRRSSSRWCSCAAGRSCCCCGMSRTAWRWSGRWRKTGCCSRKSIIG